jgi:hypothetical protein
MFYVGFERNNAPTIFYLEPNISNGVTDNTQTQLAKLLRRHHMSRILDKYSRELLPGSATSCLE